MARYWRLLIGEPTQDHHLQKSKMRYLGSQFFEAALPVLYLGIEQILMSAVQFISVKILVSSISDRNCGARQHIIHSAAQSRLFCLGRAQWRFRSQLRSIQPAIEPSRHLVPVNVP